YIILETVMGERLDAIWGPFSRLAPSEKNQISSQLRVYLDTLRRLLSPGFFGCIGKQPFEESMLWT
ncbi:hypothetical protein B0T10DRAFT_361716, partial [Thelonectria olida]